MAPQDQLTVTVVVDRAALFETSVPISAVGTDRDTMGAARGRDVSSA